MKNSTYGFFAIAALIFTAAACTKDGKLNAPTGQIAATYTKLKINQPDLMALVGADSTKTVNWTVSPSGSDTLAVKRNAARLVFTKAGTYTVDASQTGAASATITITVIDSLYVPTPDVSPFSAGEQITLTPKYVKSATSDSTWLAFTVTTKNSYCTNSSMDMGVFYDGGSSSYYMQLTQVIHNGDCGVGSAPLTGHLDYQSYYAALADGTYPLNIEFNNHPNVVGSITVTDTTITFQWDNTSGVIITPATLTR